MSLFLQHGDSPHPQASLYDQWPSRDTDVWETSTESSHVKVNHTGEVIAQGKSLFVECHVRCTSIAKLLFHLCENLFLLTDGIWPSWISIISSSVSYEYAADQCRECRGQDQEPDIPQLEGNPEELS